MLHCLCSKTLLKVVHKDESSYCEIGQCCFKYFAMWYAALTFITEMLNVITCVKSECPTAANDCINIQSNSLI